MYIYNKMEPVEGFEPPIGFLLLVYKTSAMDRSATLAF